MFKKKNTPAAAETGWPESSPEHEKAASRKTFFSLVYHKYKVNSISWEKIVQNLNSSETRKTPGGSDECF
jgi:hypothetical protein